MKQENSESVTAAVRKALRAFNEGYARRDLSALDDFMRLFVDGDELEVVGFSGGAPGHGAWRLGREAVRKLIKADWDYWGQIAADVENARVHVLGDAAWLATAAAATTFEDTQESLRSAGDERVKPLRLTAVLVKQGGRWRFQQLHFHALL